MTIENWKGKESLPVASYTKFHENQSGLKVERGTDKYRHHGDLMSLFFL